MNNKPALRLLAFLLAVALVVGLAGCGKQSGPSESNTSAAPETVYAASYTELRKDADSGLSPMLFTGEGIYASSYEKVGEEIPEGVTPEYEGQYDVYEQHYYFVDYSGKVSPLDGYTPLPVPENTENYANFTSNTGITGLAVLENGDLLALERLFVSWYDGPGEVEMYSEEYYQHQVQQQDYYLRRLDPQGQELSCAKLDLDASDLYLDSYTAVDENGNLLLSYQDEQGSGLFAFSPEGQQICSIRTDSWVNSLFTLKDGRAAIVLSGPEGLQLRVVDSAARQLGETYDIPSDAYEPFPGAGSAYDFYYTSGVNLYGYDLAAGESTKILDWISCDVNSDSLQQVYVDGTGAIRSLETSWKENAAGKNTVTTSLLTLEQKPADQLPQKTHLTLAVQYLSYELRNQIIDFNRHSDTCHIDVADYSEYNTEEDYSAGLTKLTTEILAGNVPDLLSLDNLPYTQLAKKGLLEDLYPYLDADGELSREDFFETVLQAQSVSGGLYQVSSSFLLSTLMGAESVVGSKPGWTYEQLYAALDTMPEGCQILSVDLTKEDMLETELSMNMDRLVDWETGTCRFDSQDFLDILEFADRFALEYDFESYDPSSDSDRVRIAQGRQMLMNANVSMLDDLQINSIYFGGGDNICYIGYPTVDGSLGSAFRFSSGLAMSANCADKEAGWAFLRTFLTEEYQDGGYIWNLPTNRHAFEHQLEEQMTPTWRKDAQGNFLLDENGEKIEESKGGVSFGDGTDHDIYSMTQAEADKLMALIENTTVAFGENEQITKLATEEAQAFFTGQKSAEEVAKLIQSKVNLYVNEQR